MPGYDRSRVVNSNDENLDEFVCAICQEILKKPLCTKCCGQSYCKECIYSWLTNHNTCPNDRKWLRAPDLIATPRLVNNFINKLKIKCDNFEKGCTQIVTIEELENHVKNCKAGLCQICEFPSGENDHDCIENLKIKISEMTYQRSAVKRFKEEALNCDVNNYRITEEDMIGPALRQYLVSKCQEALRNYSGESVDIFAQILCAAITKDQGDGWSVVVFLLDYGSSSVLAKKFVQIEFDGKIVIELFTPEMIVREISYYQ